RMRGTFTYSLPVNYRGTRLGVLYGNQRYRIGGDFEALGANGDLDRGSVALMHPFVRTDRHNLSGLVSLNHVEYRDRIDVVGAASETRHRYLTARMNGDLSDGVLGGGLN